MADIFGDHSVLSAVRRAGGHIFCGGSGTLTFNGQSYRLSIGGVSVGTIGVATVNLEGTGRNLRTAADIAGTYGATSASLAIVGGAKVATLKNEKGVVLEVHGVQLGLRHFGS